ncbi:MAG: hypothetical protein U0441_01020 [Polyangiaceae bacterium]
MRFFSSGAHATGFIALGQEASGVIAIGQMATGVIAIGQMARGVIAIGQLGVGLVGWGQGGVGVFHAAGMIGVGGRRGIGGVAQLVPTIGRPRVPPQATTPQFVQAGTPGWLELTLAAEQGNLALFENNNRAPIKLDRRTLAGALRITAEGPQRVWAYTRRIGNTLVCERIVHVPLRNYQTKSFLPIAIVQILFLFVLGAAYWPIAGNDVVTAVVREFGLNAAPAPAPPTPAKPPTQYKPPGK